MLLADDGYWDHNAFNDLVRRGLGTTKREDRLLSHCAPEALSPAGSQRGGGHRALHLQQAEPGGPGRQRAHQEDWSDRPADAGGLYGMCRHDMHSSRWKLWHVQSCGALLSQIRLLHTMAGTCMAARPAYARQHAQVQGSFSGMCKAACLANLNRHVWLHSMSSKQTGFTGGVRCRWVLWQVLGLLRWAQQAVADLLAPALGRCDRCQA